MRKIYSSLLAIAIIATLQSAQALEYKVLAVVNGESISSVQVRNRAELVIDSTGQQRSVENRRKTTEEITEILINETLQKQDAKAKGVEVTDKEMTEVILDLESRNGLKPGGFKQFAVSKGFSYETLLDQIKASILWRKVLTRYVRPGIDVTDADIAKVQEKETAQKKDLGNKVDLSEIIIPVSFDKEAETKELVDTIVRTARTGGKDFGELAQKYSSGKTASKKGSLGWLPENGIVNPLAATVKKTAAGKVADPMKVGALYVIIKVNKREPIVPVDNTSPKDKAYMAKIEEGGKKYIKTLRENAYIERKYKPEELFDMVWGG